MQHLIASFENQLKQITTSGSVWVRTHSGWCKSFDSTTVNSRKTEIEEFIAYLRKKALTPPAS